MNYSPPLFKDRPRPVQIVLGGVIPFALGAVQGILIGVSPVAYWIVAVLATRLASTPPAGSMARRVARSAASQPPSVKPRGKVKGKLGDAL